MLLENINNSFGINIFIITVLRITVESELHGNTDCIAKVIKCPGSVPERKLCYPPCFTRTTSTERARRARGRTPRSALWVCPLRLLLAKCKVEQTNKPIATLSFPVETYRRPDMKTRVKKLPQFGMECFFFCKSLYFSLFAFASLCNPRCMYEHVVIALFYILI